MFFPLFPTKDVVHNIDISIVSLSAIPICRVFNIFLFFEKPRKFKPKNIWKKNKKTYRSHGYEFSLILWIISLS